MKLPTAVAALALAGCATRQAGSAQVQGTGGCKQTSAQEIAALFDRWNASLQTGDPHQVVAHYAEKSILLPTVSNQPRLTPAEKNDYFQEFLKKRPSGKIDLRFVDIGCNSAVDVADHEPPFVGDAGAEIDRKACSCAPGSGLLNR